METDYLSRQFLTHRYGKNDGLFIQFIANIVQKTSFEILYPNPGLHRKSFLYPAPVHQNM